MYFPTYLKNNSKMYLNKNKDIKSDNNDVQLYEND